MLMRQRQPVQRPPRGFTRELQIVTAGLPRDQPATDMIHDPVQLAQVSRAARVVTEHMAKVKRSRQQV